ncbi:MAG: V-type ATP synthase subunit A, partial [Candidatus Methanomethylophilaceae archaeon]|nr:V-type ATP synthase subunit A [Candidatus Methanomethylophilaceae archaeon]
KQLSQWYSDEVAADFPALREWAMLTLQKESELQEIVQLVGSDALPDEQKATLEVSKMIREIFLQQNAYHPVDTYSPMSRQYVMLKLIRKYADLSAKAVQAGVPLDKFVSIPARQRFIRAKLETNIDAELKAVGEDMDAQFKALGV